MATSVDSESAASSPTVRTFHACRRFAVAGPTPHTHSKGRGWRNASSRSGGTAIRPSGFATPLATFARNLVRAMPTVTGNPTRSRPAARRQHDTASDDHRASAKARVVPLLDRREERVRVRVQNEHMFDTLLEP